MATKGLRKKRMDAIACCMPKTIQYLASRNMNLLTLKYTEH